MVLLNSVVSAPTCTLTPVCWMKALAEPPSINTCAAAVASFLEILDFCAYPHAWQLLAWEFASRVIASRVFTALQFLNITPSWSSQSLR